MRTGWWASIVGSVPRDLADPDPVSERVSDAEVDAVGLLARLIVTHRTLANRFSSRRSTTDWGISATAAAR
jgi:hypothetical protein